MSKGTKNKNGFGDKKTGKVRSESNVGSAASHRSKNGYLLSMSHAPTINEASNIFQMIPVLFFTAVIIMITRMAPYQRPMEQFYWSLGDNKLNDFFSYYKMMAIVICAVLALVLLLYRIFIQAFYVKRSFAYIPMAVYSAFVLLSYIFSDYKLFSLWGWNDRFEGTVTLLSYMIILFFVINTINAEKNIKVLIYVLAATSTLLGLLGLTQAIGHDFFQTTLGKKLITPTWFWDQIDGLNFTFQNNEIYQTVYNINYVSFYLTLLIPLFGLLFIRSVMLGKDEPLYKKLIWGALFTLLIYNLIGSASSGGLMGMAIAVVAAIIILNKRILEWWKPICILLIITVLVAGASYSRWMPELNNAIGGVIGNKMQSTETESESSLSDNGGETLKHKLDYIITEGDNIILGYDGDTINIETFFNDPGSVVITDSSGTTLTVSPVENTSAFQLNDARFNWVKVQPVKDENNNYYLVLTTDEQDWPFLVTKDGPKFMNGLGKLVDMKKETPSIGWKSNPDFGSGRGFIWSRSLPMTKETLVLGHGADTYCIYFPHNDYVGKYNAGWDINLIVDKPHNMYMGITIGTGGISLLALLVLWGFYLVQGIRIYWRQEYKSFTSYVGIGILLGICGFLAAGLVNDTSVSVMPMFYGLLGTGIVTNMILENQI
ncbi:MAG: hypothetical protein K0Q73_7695 [Paenibacillus sp.]|jgi:hypothetical protein|nr:hypothetical protein [Paenibacillus sp.]